MASELKNIKWEPFTVNKNDVINCNYGKRTDVHQTKIIAIIPTYSHSVRIDLASQVKQNVMTKWINALTDEGAGVILMEGIDNLWTLSNWARSGKDGFNWLTNRIKAVVQESISRKYTEDDKIIVMGTSRHGYASMHALANIPSLAGAIALMPIVWWPNLEEFLGMEENHIVKQNELSRWVDNFPPRPLLVQTGYNDKRAGQKWIMRLLEQISQSYSRSQMDGRFTHELMSIRGHGGERLPEESIYRIIPWLSEQQLL